MGKQAGKRVLAPRPSQEMMPAPKKPRRVLVCNACRKKPQEVAWAARDERDQPVDSRCMPCHEKWSRCFTYLHWCEFAELGSTQVLHGVPHVIRDGPMVS